MTDLFDQSQPRPPRGIALDVEFGAFWPLYPRHVARKKAYEAFKTARRQHSIETIMCGVQRYAAHVQGIETQYILHASTWLNGERWDDDLVPRGSGQPSGANLFDAYGDFADARARTRGGQPSDRRNAPSLEFRSEDFPRDGAIFHRRH